jgi:hypothetical protein
MGSAGHDDHAAGCASPAPSSVRERTSCDPTVVAGPVCNSGDAGRIGPTPCNKSTAPLPPMTASMLTPSARQHARQLLTAAVAQGYGGRELLFGGVLILYERMCRDMNWRPRPWNPVGAELRLLTTGHRKAYRWLIDPADGRARRYRTYPIPSVPQGNRVAMQTSRSEVKRAA